MSQSLPPAADIGTSGLALGAGRAAAEHLPDRVRLGEELPIFCERCGYLLHGSPQTRCEHCTILYFRCPECGHAQPINTLRPAVQRILGRTRAVFLAGLVFFKINYFLWLLVAWVAMGGEWSYQYRSLPVPTSPGGRAWVLQPRPLDLEVLLVFMLFALPFGMVSRMMLLRWKRGYLIGLVLAALVVLAIVGGARLRAYDTPVATSPFTADFHLLLSLTGLAVILGAAVAWGLWSALVRLFLPASTATALLDWQRSQSSAVSALGRS